LQKEFNNSEQTNQKPEKFDHKSWKIKTEKQRNDNHRRPDGVEQGINQTAAFDSLCLQQNVSNDNDSRADGADEIVPGVLHQKIISSNGRELLNSCWERGCPHPHRRASGEN
jgi:hypothetical protein